MKIQDGILFLTEDIFPDGTLCDTYYDSEKQILCVFEKPDGRKVIDRQMWVGERKSGEYDYKIENGRLFLHRQNNILTPELVGKTPMEEAHRIMGINKDLKDITRDDILQKIFELAHEAQNADNRAAIPLRVAIDAFQWLYDEIKKQPPKRIGNEVDKSTAFLKEWGINIEESV